MIRVTKGSVLGPDQFNIFFNILDNGIKYIPGKFTDDTKLEGVNDLPEGHTDTQMNHDRLEKQAHKKKSHNVQQEDMQSLAPRTRCLQSLHILGAAQLESSSVEKDLGVLMDTKMNTSQQ